VESDEDDGRSDPTDERDLRAGSLDGLDIFEAH